jgi:uncharacterized membrane protein
VEKQVKYIAVEGQPEQVESSSNGFSEVILGLESIAVYYCTLICTILLVFMIFLIFFISCLSCILPVYLGYFAFFNEISITCKKKNIYIAYGNQLGLRSRLQKYIN